MKLSEFTRRARASRMERKAKYEAAFQRAIRDLNLSDISTGPANTVTPVSYIRSEFRRPVLTLFRQRETS